MSQWTAGDYAKWLHAFLCNPTKPNITGEDRWTLITLRKRLESFQRRIDQLKTQNHAMMYGRPLKVAYGEPEQPELFIPTQPKEPDMAFDRKKPKFRIFHEATVKGQVDACPRANFYDTLEEAEARAVQILAEHPGSVLHIFMTVAVIEPAPQYTKTAIDIDAVKKAVTRKRKR
jgi:hypothetical protein